MVYYALFVVLMHECIPSEETYQGWIQISCRPFQSVSTPWCLGAALASCICVSWHQRTLNHYAAVKWLMFRQRYQISIPIHTILIAAYGTSILEFLHSLWAYVWPKSHPDGSEWIIEFNVHKTTGFWNHTLWCVWVIHVTSSGAWLSHLDYGSLDRWLPWMITLNGGLDWWSVK